MKKIDRDDYTQVATWLRKQKVDEQDDEKSAFVLADKGFSMPDDKAPDVAWAHGGPLRFKDDVMQVFRNDRWQSVLKKIKTTRPTDKKLRQFRFDLKDVKLAQDHLKEHGSLKKGGRSTRHQRRTLLGRLSPLHRACLTIISFCFGSSPTRFMSRNAACFDLPK